MHQPYYKDLVTGEYKLPWTRLHALKDYYGMVEILREFPAMQQTFNLVPSMLAQIEDYAAGAAADPFLRVALKPAEQLTEAEQSFLLQYFFQANPGQMIYRWRRYGELHDLWQSAHRDPARARRLFDVAAFRDLQVLSQLAWFDEESFVHHPPVRELLRKGRNFSLDDQALMGSLQNEALRRVLPAYREFAASGQIEISTTPFYHPILPLLCDSSIAEVSHPYVPLPPRFRYPQDARVQLERAAQYMQTHMGARPAGLWPSEGSVSDEALTIAADCGFQWFAADNGVLARTLHCEAGPGVTYQPYLWSHNGRRLHGIFRDHFLSDLVGFVYSRMSPQDAAGHFLDRVRENCRPILSAGRDALVPIVLDGENAWEHYDRNGRPFLRELYRRICDDPSLSPVTVSQALARVEPQPLDRIFPGSWIEANFDVWIGFEEDNRAWEYLLKARETYDRAVEGPHADPSIPDDRKQLAFEELLIAEGSDWCWWYGPHHDSANRPEFDQLFRGHLANVYSLLGLAPPEELSRPILHVSVAEFHQEPSGPVRATIDGENTSYFEWMGAGVYRVDARHGAMHGQRFLVQQLHYGSDGANLYLRLDLAPDTGVDGAELEVVVNVQHPATGRRSLRLKAGHHEPAAAQAAFRRIWECRLSLTGLGIPPRDEIQFQVSLWQASLPVDALPPQGWLRFSTAEPIEWPL